MLISAANPYAVEAGRKIALAGGNVIDVAVTVGLTMSVTSPFFAALGGGGFALVKMGNEPEALDFREVAPQATGKDYYLNLPKDASTVGGHAVGVPGMPAGWLELHRKYGKLTWAKLFADPIRLAKEGFAISGEWQRKTNSERDSFNASAKRRLYKKDGYEYEPGEILKQPDLAKALELLRDKKTAGFYQGAVAKDIADSVKAGGGKLTTDDLKKYKTRWLKPLETEFANHTIYLMPPPSSGGVVIASALKLMDKLKLALKSQPLSHEEFHLLAEVQARAFRGRSMLADPDFNNNPIPFLLSDKYLTEMSKSINLKRTAALKPLAEGQAQETTETTHFSVMDTSGHAVAITITLNGDYGSGILTEKFGIALNNEMDDFTTRPGEANMFGLVQGAANAVEPGKRPLSSMSPTIVVNKEGKAVMSLGAPGGPRIISGVLQVLYRTLALGTDVDLAVQAPRVHHQFLPNKVFIDSGRFTPETINSLRERGHVVEEGWMGRVYLVRQRPDGLLEGTFDSRGEGAVGGI